jgi:CRP-like cAMP-binding protein
MSIEQEIDVLRRVPVFSMIGPAMQKLLCLTSERLVFESGQAIFRQGDAANAAYVVIDGYIDVTVAAPGGERVVNTVGPYELVGEASMFSDLPRTATAMAKSRIEVLRIGKDVFCEMVRDNPGAALHMTQLLARRLANTTALLGTQAAGATG